MTSLFSLRFSIIVLVPLWLCTLGILLRSKYCFCFEDLFFDRLKFNLKNSSTFINRIAWSNENDIAIS